ncbi:TPA: SDR family oxidoreductase [Pseudomonas aeruginosa]|uniref:SDR family oxidoreductase n=1 Tax=Pseudomonas aeruginosa TaxID=287 RepID=UPI0009AB4AC7|nr:SDR family oxidoreductase [Pseudomonas aeruginosa]
MHLAWTLSAELLEHGIRVNALSPGPSAGQGRYRSRGRPGAEGEDCPGRLGEPLEIASAALFLASNEPRCRYGTESLVDGGVRHLKKGAKARSW